MTMDETPSRDEWIAANRAAWNQKADGHFASGFYRVDDFRARPDASTLKPPELELVGDVAGRALLHLQCHFGLDTLSWARRGARVTGVDLSDRSIELARNLAGDLGLDATFTRGDAQALDPSWRDAFDVVVSSYGVLCWLADLDRWAVGISRVLRPGGCFVLVEFHPVMDVLHPGKLTGRPSYFPSGSFLNQERGSYAAPDATFEVTEYLWQHPVGEVVTALAGAGLVLEVLAEYPYCSYPLFPELDLEREGRWERADGQQLEPYMYGLRARRPSAP
jgi:SAM-dependent methyltransferase